MFDCMIYSVNPGPEVIKLFFMLNSAEHENLNPHKEKKLSMKKVL